MPIKKNKDWLLPEGIPEILPLTGIPVGQAMDTYSKQVGIASIPRKIRK